MEQVPPMHSYHTKPSCEGYDFQEVFHGTFGRTGFENSHHHIKAFDQPLMDEVAHLEEAKHAAATAVTTLLSVQNAFPRLHGADSDPSEWKKSHEAAIKAERLVVKCRIAMLNKLIPQHDILTNMTQSLDEGRHSVFAAVNYRQLVANNDKDKAIAVQTPCTWNTDWPWQLINDIKVINEPHIKNHSLNILISSILEQIPRNHGMDALNKSKPNILDLNYHSYMCGEEHHAEFSRWQHSEPNIRGVLLHMATNGVDTVQVIVGVLNMNYCDKWHNPLINKYVQEAIKDSSAQNMRQNEIHRNNTMKLTVVIQNQHTIHVLDLSPVVTPDTCCIQHIFVNDQHGILNLVDKDITQVKVDEGATHTLRYKWYYSPGSHKNQRMNEQSLNAIHSRAFRIQNSELRQLRTADMPDPNELMRTPDTQTPPAKSTRISFTDHDILVTSYQPSSAPCKTVITVVRYPPFGLQYKKIPPPPPEIKYVQAPPSHGQQRRINPFDEIPPPGIMKFIIWYSEDGKQRWTLHLIDHDPTRAGTREMMRKGKEINREIWEQFKDTGRWVEYDRQAMVNNILHNNETGKDERTVRQIYRDEWGLYIKEILDSCLNAAANDDIETPYLFCKEETIWEELERGKIIDSTTITTYTHYANTRFVDDFRSGKINPENIREQAPTIKPTDAARRLGTAAVVPPGTIAIPGGARQNATTPAAVLALVREMKERISALEGAKTDESRAEGNTEHLLRQVLNTLARKP
jgi:hypothetical protein